jgi:hypothetical protein
MIDVVYATNNATQNRPEGGIVVIRKGTHWPASDPMVLRYPDIFSPDPRWGLEYTEEPPGWNDPPAEPLVTGRNAGRRAGSRA